MKRYDHLYEKIYDLENLRKAHQHAKKGKGWYKEVQEIDKEPDQVPETDSGNAYQPHLQNI